MKQEEPAYRLLSVKQRSCFFFLRRQAFVTKDLRWKLLVEKVPSANKDRCANLAPSPSSLAANRSVIPYDVHQDILCRRPCLTIFTNPGVNFTCFPCTISGSNSRTELPPNVRIVEISKNAKCGHATSWDTSLNKKRCNEESVNERTINESVP